MLPSNPAALVLAYMGVASVTAIFLVGLAVVLFIMVILVHDTYYYFKRKSNAQK